MKLTAPRRTAGRLAAALGILAALLVLVGARPAAAEERTAPYVSAAFANAPGAITLEWIHPGEGVYGYAIQLQEGERWLDAAQLDHTFGRYTLGGLAPETWYTLRVCAVYGPLDSDRECSEPEARVRTQAPERPPSGGGNASLAPPANIRLSAGADFVRVDWGQTGPYDKILVRLSDTLGNVDQRDVRNHANGYLEFEGMRPGAEYHVVLKGCNDGAFGSTCGPWSADHAITTALVKHSRSSFESVNVPGHFIRHRFSLGELTRVSSDLDKKDATFIVRFGLSPVPGAVSLESVNYPDHFLRHNFYRLKLHRNDGSELFRQDATFVVRAGLNGVPGTLSFESSNYPGHFLRHRNFEFWLDRNDGSALFRDDATFRQQPPRAP